MKANFLIRKQKLDNLTKVIEKKDVTFETEQQAQEKQSEVEKLIKKHEERITELGKKEKEKNRRKKEKLIR